MVRAPFRLSLGGRSLVNRNRLYACRGQLERISVPFARSSAVWCVQLSILRLARLCIRVFFGIEGRTSYRKSLTRRRTRSVTSGD
jgi:hypothetical protein